MQAMSFKMDKSTNCQTNVITLGSFKTTLSTFQVSELFETTMLDFHYTQDLRT